MRFIGLLTIMVFFSFSGMANSQCPKVLFYNGDYDNYKPFNTKDLFYGTCGDGKVHVKLAICEAETLLTSVIEKVEWDMGNGTPVITTNSLDIYYTYPQSGQYTIKAKVYLTVGVGGESCVLDAGTVIENNATSFSDLCERPINANYIQLDVVVFNFSLDVSPANQTLYTTTPVAITVNYSGSMLPGNPATYSLFIDGAPASPATIGALPANNGIVIPAANYAEGQHIAEIVISSKSDNYCVFSATVPFEIIPYACGSCFTFKPDIEKRYWVSAWVKEDVVNPVITYSNLVNMQLEFLGTAETVTLYPTGDIIDGWQRIAGDFKVPTGTTNINISLVNNNTTIAASFDDVRIHPFKGSMKSYAYDASTFWLMAELDDNNYATFYEYDKEGQLIRIKKETEKGIMTIQESRSSNPKAQ